MESLSLLPITTFEILSPTLEVDRRGTMTYDTINRHTLPYLKGSHISQYMLACWLTETTNLQTEDRRNRSSASPAMRLPESFAGTT